MCPGFDSRTQRHMWVEFVAGSLLCFERFFSGYSSFPLSSKAHIAKFQFDPGMHRHFLGAPWVNKLHLHYINVLFTVKAYFVDPFKESMALFNPRTGFFESRLMLTKD